MSNAKRSVYAPQYARTAHSHGRPLQSFPKPYFVPLDENPEEQNIVNVQEIQVSSPHFSVGNAPTSQSILTETSNKTIWMICLIIFGCIVLLAAIVAIVFSVILNLGGTSSTTSSASGVTTVSTTTALYTCSNFNVTMNWDYPNNDITNALPMTFDLCCFWCLSVNSCTTFIFINTTSNCYIKTSTGNGGLAAPGRIAATR